MITKDEILKKLENPICYITGDNIVIEKTSSWHLDHIIPRSRGGDNSIDNCGIATKEANLAKSNMTYDEFVKFCYKVIKHYEKSQLTK